MIYSVTGTLIHIEPGVAVVECGGVGFKCLTSMGTLRRLPNVGGQVKLYTKLNVREDAMELFGFSTENELNCFQLLTSVSGVGPKAALSILSAATPESLAMSIITGDPGHRQKNRPAHHPGAERQAGQGTDRPWRRELWRHRRHGNPGEQVQRGRCRPGSAGLQPERDCRSSQGH